VSVFINFSKLRKDQSDAADNYELDGSYEMAYLALWTITEHTVKEIEVKTKTDKLKVGVGEWYQYFQSNRELERPKPIRSFVCDVKTIPPIKNLTEVLGEIPAIGKLLQTTQKGKSTKYRDKRNNIAHTAEKFRSEAIYQDYKNVALSAIEELERKLNKVEYK
jgi:hypothetical protein